MDILTQLQVNFKKGESLWSNIVSPIVLFLYCKGGDPVSTIRGAGSPVPLFGLFLRVTNILFRSNKGKLINADLNASYQIIRKVFPEAFAEGIEGVGLHPIRVNIA
jgi:hypothetical protein